jgi:hypothetical protein
MILFAAGENAGIGRKTRKFGGMKKGCNFA